MAQSLLTFPVRKRKDLVVLRQRSRQIAAMLGYVAEDQAAIAAAAFAIVNQTFHQQGTCTVYFQIADSVFEVFPVTDTPTGLHGTGAIGSRITPSAFEAERHPAPLRLEKPLPLREPPLADADLTFVAQDLNRLTPPDLFAEIERQNQELLQVLMELRSCQAKLSELTPRQVNTSAA
jgi:hypothetical protein